MKISCPIWEACKISLLLGHENTVSSQGNCKFCVSLFLWFKGIEGLSLNGNKLLSSSVFVVIKCHIPKTIISDQDLLLLKEPSGLLFGDAPPPSNSDTLLHMGKAIVLCSVIHISERW